MCSDDIDIMVFGIRGRTLTWLVLVILPAIGVGWFTLDLVGDRLTSRVEGDIANFGQLEAARIDDMLDDYESEANATASGRFVVDLVGVTVAARQPGSPVRFVGGYDGIDQVSPLDDEPLNQLTELLLERADSAGSNILDLQVVAIDGSILGRSAGFSWQPSDGELVERVIAAEVSQFGDAFRTAGDDRVGIVTPVRNRRSEVVGAMLVESDLTPIVDLVAEHRNFGETNEAHIAQPTANGDAQYLTSLRFDADAAFTRIVPAEANRPIHRSFDAVGGLLVRGDDYRDVDSVLALETIEATGWGLVVKIDSAEALAPVAEVRRALAIAGVLTLVLVVGCSAILLNPLVRRLKQLAAAAGRIAEGDYQTRIDDHTADEVGELARSIDQLAADLASDIEARESAESQLRHQVSHDHLTGIHNRHHATARIAELSRSGSRSWSVLFLDLDEFKTINDTHGHGVGDEILTAVAGRLSNRFSDRATVARWGGDEFVLVFGDTDRLAAGVLAEEVRRVFLAPVSTSVGTHTVRCSVGVATSSNDDHSSLDHVLLEADAAMFAQKPIRRDRRRVWSIGERTVSTALKEDRVEVWYQPLINTLGGADTVIGAEALVRLRAPDGQIVPPAGFLGPIIDSEIGIALDLHVAATAANAAAQWLSDGLIGSTFQMSVNVGPRLARDRQLADHIERALIHGGLPPHMVAIEISEMAGALDMPAIRALTDLGAMIAIDDVGMSRSNFDRLIQVRPAFAKLDRRWLSSVDPDALIVLRSLVAICDQLGAQVVAEGIETPAQQELVNELGVHLVQGFLYGKAVPATEFQHTWLKNRQPNRYLPQ